MEVEGLLALLGSVLPEAGPFAFDLDTATGFLLNMLDILPTVADHRSSQVETRDWLQPHHNPFFGPLAL